MSGARRRFLLGRGADVDASVAAVITDAGSPVFIDNSALVNIVNDGDVDIIYRTVIEKPPIFPTSAFVTSAEIAKSVIDAAIKTYRRAPEALVENICFTAPSPPGRSP